MSELSKLNGWAGKNNPNLVKDEFNLLKDAGSFKDFKIFGATKSSKGQKMMLYDVVRKVIGKDTENYAQEIGDPFRAGTMVLMYDGTEKPVEEVRPGDVVYNHKGEPAKVSKFIKKSFTGDIVTISLDGWDRDVSATETHHGMVIKSNKCERKKFGEMVEGDYVLIPDISFDYEESCSFNHNDFNNGAVLTKQKKNNAYGVAMKIVDITKEKVVDEEVYCITTENEYTAIFNGMAHYQCVSFGAKNAVEYLMATEKLMKGDHEEFTPVFPPYLYGTGRVFIGRGQLNGDDGSLGSWMADAVIKYGVLRSDYPGVPKYAGSVASKWGDSPGPDQKFVNEGKLHPVKSAAKIESWDDLRDAIVNGYPCTTASNIGYDMEPSNDGFHRQTDEWGHQMCIIGIDDGYKNGSDPYAIILNSWGDCHGNLKDFNTGDSLPVGVLRVRKKDIEKHIREDETFAYSNFEGFPEQLIDKKLFMLI